MSWCAEDASAAANALRQSGQIRIMSRMSVDKRSSAATQKPAHPMSPDKHTQSRKAPRRFATCAGRSPPSASLYAELCAALPALHAAALQLIGLELRTGGSGALLAHAPAARLLARQLRRLAAAGATVQFACPWPVRLCATPGCRVL